MLKRLVYLIVLAPNILLSQDKPFQVLVCNKATIYGQEVKPLQMVDDVTSIEVGDDGFLAMVHKGGTTYEVREKVFTFYLKPSKIKNRSQRPALEVLYSGSSTFTSSKLITLLHPSSDASGYFEWDENVPLKIYWYLHGHPVLNYKITISDHNGKKIQDYRTNKNTFDLKPGNFGLAEPLFNFSLSSTFAGQTMTSKNYAVSLKPSVPYDTKAADKILMALDLEPDPLLALTIWKEAIAMPNGQEYLTLYEKFLRRNTEVLTSAGQNVVQLLSENR